MAFYPWSDTTQYLEGDIVSFIPPIGAQALYYCITPALGENQSPTNTSFWIVYTGGTAVQSLTAGQGISLGGSSQNPSILTNISAQGPSLVLLPTTGTNYLLSNAQPFVGLTPGANVTITGGTSNAGVFTGGPLTIAAADATPFLGLVAGSNLVITGGSSNAGVVTGGPLTLAATAAGSVTSVSAGTGISVTGPATTPTIANTGVVSVASGANGISVAGPSASPSVSLSWVSYNTTMSVAGNTNNGGVFNTAFNYTIAGGTTFVNQLIQQVNADTYPGDVYVQVLIDFTQQFVPSMPFFRVWNGNVTGGNNQSYFVFIRDQFGNTGPLVTIQLSPGEHLEVLMSGPTSGTNLYIYSCYKVSSLGGMVAGRLAA